jgi:hypothetical protein
MTQRKFLIDGAIESALGHLEVNQDIHLNGALVMDGIPL